MLSRRSGLPFNLAIIALCITLGTAPERAWGKELLEYDALSTTASALSVTDITLEAPVSAITCGAAEIDWSWDRQGALPSEPITLSIINATDFGSRRKRSSNRHIDYMSNLPLHKRALSKRLSGEGMLLDGGSNLPFNQVSFQWEEIDVVPGQYRLLLTVVATNDSVVSDPFTVDTGHTESCLSGTTVTSSGAPQTFPSGGASSSASATSTAAGATHTASNDQSGVSSATGSTAASATGSSSGSRSSTQESASQSNNTGAIAAGVLVPLLVILGGAIAFFWRRKRQISTAGSEGSNGHAGDKWYEKLMPSGPRAGGTAQHRRQISGPGKPTAAGLASVAKMVPAALRSEKDEAALQHSASEGRSPRTRRDTGESEASYGSNPGGEHWVDFRADEMHNIDGARPLSPSTIDSQTFSVIGGTQQLYSQGQNVPLSHFSTSGSSANRNSTLSSADSRGSIATFSTLNNPFINGRDLIASVPQRRSAGDLTGSSAMATTDSASSSSSSSSPFGDEHAATTSTTSASTDVTTHQRSDSQNTVKLERSDSDGKSGVKRKPVPRFSAAPQKASKATAPMEADPFSNASVVSGSIELLRSSGETNAVPSTPPRPPFRFHAATPSSIPETAMSDTSSVHRYSPDLPTSVTEDSLAVSAQSDVEGGRDKAYHLSINLGSENGFRMSFT